MKKNITIFALLLSAFFVNAQEKTIADKSSNERIKIDGVAVVVGKNIVLDSDIEKFKKELKNRLEGELDITDCEILEEIMTQKLIAHHAVVDSVVVSDAEVNSEVERNIAYFGQQLGSMEKVIEFYGFTDEEDLREELGGIQREQLLIRSERASITENIDVTPEEVRTYFKNLEKDGNLPEFSAEIEIAQIVKTLKPTEEEVGRVIEKLLSLKKEIEEGYSFKLKALINSDDPGATQNGGMITLTRQSNYIKEFKEVAFALDKGEISEPFQSGFGIHILLVEEIRGQERDVRHILIVPVISDEEMKASQNELIEARTKVLNGEMTFEEAVLEYSDDVETNLNGGLILNPETNDTRFDLTRIDPTLYKRVSNLKVGEITEPYFDQIRMEPNVFKILLLKSKIETHEANFTQDYEKIQKLTLQKKQEETIEKWAKDKIVDTYIKIHPDFKKCTFKNNWKKE